MKGTLIDIGHSEEDGQSYVDLYVKGEKLEVIKEAFDPYFYFEGAEPEHELVKKAELSGRLWKVFVNAPGDVPKLREELVKQGRIFEYDIPYTQRYLIDHDIVPFTVYEWKKGKPGKPLGDYEPSRVAFDIETYNPRGMPEADKDAIVMVSTHDGEKGAVYTWKKIGLPFVKSYKNEGEMLANFVEGMDYDVVYTYNGDNFDLPYVKTRVEELGIKEGMHISLRQGMRGLKARIPGKVHIDAYRGMVFLSVIGALKLPRYTLEDVYKELTGKEKLDIDTKNLWKIWDKGSKAELEELATYSLQDSEAAFELGEQMLPLYTALSKLINQMPFDVSRMTSSQIVELLLLKMAKKRGEIAPNRPVEGEFKARVTKQLKGAFVREPEPGLHEDIVVLDFKGLYPSIIISHNIDPSTLDCDCCKDPFESPMGQKFCRKKRGLIPEMLEKVVGARAGAKKKLKSAKGKEKRDLGAEQQALKIVANSTYGYMNYARARWYSYDCAEATTAWGRKFIKDAASEAEKRGFKVIYGDTDSVFMLRGGKSKEDVLKFLKDYNDSLPGKMELELEGFYPRGIFVTKKEGGAAKKRYALIREDGQIEIKGLEFVRRDWSQIAKRTQREVIQRVLENDVEGAKALVLEKIELVRKNKVPIDEYVIRTQLKRRIAKYSSQGPHVRAAMRLEESGEKVGKGTLIEYVVCQGAGNIGDRSYSVRMLGKRKPDVDYYVTHQLLPAVMKILAEFGISADELMTGTKQAGLGAWA
ncbi:DNA-directed DNA polymerase [archaeon]